MRKHKIWLIGLFTIFSIIAFFSELYSNPITATHTIDASTEHADVKEDIESFNTMDNEPAIITVEATIIEDDEWDTGIASAYGGDTDSQVIDNQITATGDVVDDFSMGVAIPMSWTNYKSYFGKHVYIKYGDVIVEAVVNDCGYLDGGTRALDLQPGVWRALGASTCDDWGLRQIEYQIVI